MVWLKDRTVVRGSVMVPMPDRCRREPDQRSGFWRKRLNLEIPASERSPAEETHWSPSPSAVRTLLDKRYVCFFRFVNEWWC